MKPIQLVYRSAFHNRTGKRVVRRPDERRDFSNNIGFPNKHEDYRGLYGYTQNCFSRIEFQRSSKVGS